MSKTYDDHLRNPHWQRLRLQVLERDGWRCLRCGAGLEDDPALSASLEIHHREYAGPMPWDTPVELLETRCEKCHDSERIPRPLDPVQLTEWLDRLTTKISAVIAEAQELQSAAVKCREYYKAGRR